MTLDVWRGTFQVNTGAAEPGIQGLSAAVGLASGNIVVAWSDLEGTFAPDPGLDLVARIYDAEGRVIRDVFQLNTQRKDAEEYRVDLAPVADGGFVAVYESAELDGQSIVATSLVWERFDARGHRVAGGDLVTLADGEILRGPEISVDLDRDLAVVTWGYASDGDELAQDLVGRTVSLTDGTLSPVFPAVQNAPDLEILGDTAFLSGGDVVQVWEAYDLSGGINDATVAVEGRVLRPTGSGTTVLAEFTVASSALAPRVAALRDGGFVVAHADAEGDLSLRFFTEAGVQASVVEGVGDTLDTSSSDHAALPLPDGRFLVASDTGSAIDALVFEADGTPSGDAARIAGINATELDVALTSDGRVLFTWSLGEIGAAIWDPRDGTIAVADYDDLPRMFVDNAGPLTARRDADTSLLGGGRDGLVLLGQNGDDTIDGGEGGQILQGGAGNDGYILRGAYGDDRIVGEPSGADRLIFPGRNREDARIVADGNDLIVATGVHTVRVANQFPDPRVEVAAFDDGEVPLTGRAIGEWGRIGSLADASRTVAFQNTYADPVVFVGPLTFAGPQLAVARVTEVTSESFTVFAQEPNHRDGSHVPEDVGFFVLERGRWQFDSGVVVEVGSVETDILSDAGFVEVSFTAPFAAPGPVVLSQVQTFAGSDFVDTRQRDTTATGFRLAMTEEEARNTGGHVDETVGWVAIEPGVNFVGGEPFEALTTASVHDESPTLQPFFPFIFGVDAPTVVASLASFRGSDPAFLRTNSIAPQGVEFVVQEDRSLDPEVNHVDEQISYVAFTGASGTIEGHPAPAMRAIGEWGRLSDLDDEPRVVTLSHHYVDPVVFAGPLSRNGDQLAVPRFTEVTGKSFTLFAQEPNYRDGRHVDEDIGWLVVERGAWLLEDGTVLEADAQESDLLTSQGFERLDFDAPFDAPPVVLSQVQTFNGPDFVGMRQRDADVAGVALAMQEEEALNDGSHRSETIGWLAVEAGLGMTRSGALEARTTPRRFDDDVEDMRFTAEFEAAPTFLASLASFNGPDPAFLRREGITLSAAALRVQEDRSADAEVNHVTEAVSFLALEGERGALVGTELFA